MDRVPVATSAEVLAVLPSFLRTSDPAPVRDALIAALTEVFRTYQVKAAYAAAQADPGRATGIYLEGLAEDHNVFRQPAETLAQLRARIFSAPSIVTPAAIIAAVNSIVLPFTTIEPQVFEDIDCNFITDDGGGANGYAYDTFVGSNPRAPSRLYHEDAVENGGYERDQAQPGGFWVFGDTNGRYFVVRLPSLVTADDNFTFVTSAGDDASFISDGSDTSGSEANGHVIEFTYTSNTTSDEIYDAVCTAIERIKGQGIRFQVIVDTGLT